jgi:hypothetical protein
MNASQPPGNLPEGLSRKLRAIRRRALGLALARAAILAAAALLGCMAVAMIIDWFFAWLHPFPRYAALFVTLTFVLVLVLIHRPRRRTIIGTAREVDEAVPQLEERWSTVTELSQTKDSPEVRGSETMIKRVASEADVAANAITPETLVSSQPVIHAARWLSAAVAALVIFFVINFTEANLLLQRFWMPDKNISLTQITASPANTWVPKGEPLVLNAALKGRVPRERPTLFVEGGRPTRMTAKPASAGTFTYSVEDVSDSFGYRIRAGDGQTPWLSITAVDRPRIAEVKLKVSPPSYSKLPVDEQNALPQVVRILEGSALQVSFRADQPLERMSLDLGNGQSHQLTAGGDNWYHFTAHPTNSFSFAAAAWNRFNLDNRTKPFCRVTVYEDLAPTVKILEPSDNIAVLPGEKVDVSFEAADDFGVAKAELTLETTKADGETNLVKIPIELEAQAGKKQLRKHVQIDTKELGLKHGDQLSYTVQVTDTKETPSSASAESKADARDPAAEQVEAKNSEQKSSERESKPGEPQESKAAATSKESQEQAKDAQAKQSQEQAKNAAESKESQQQTKSAAESKKSEEQAKNTAESKPDEMTKRMLDVGQSSACKPRNINVDETAGSFDGEKREKLEIAIDPVLKRLDLLLGQAQTNTIQLNFEPARTNLVAAEGAITNLTSRTTGTPYAFIGLQLQNIGQAHISPAHHYVSGETNVEKASFHIGRAREMLANLTKTYETVKRDQKIADAMQRLSKMYQIFLEDTQALLGSGKGRINSYERKIAEVDDEFAEKLKELLEERKKIMAELARILADDPRLLRRYLALMELQGTTLRDQFTLLAERQTQIQQQLAEWNAAPEADRGAVTQKLRQTYASERQKIVEDATKLRENMETWLPLDVDPKQEQVQSALSRAEMIARLAAESGTNAAHQALTEMHALRESLPHFSHVNSTNKAKLTGYIANRLPEVESLITAHSGQMKIMESFNSGDFPKVAEVVQHRLHQDTYTLGEKLITAEEQVGHMSAQIFDTAASLNRTVQGDIIQPQRSSVEKLAVREVKPAEQIINKIPPTFHEAENKFDELMRLIIAQLDKAPAPQGDPGEAETLQDILALLQDEAKACENLGIPCRPLNVTIMRDWMRPGSGQGQGQGRGRAQAQAAALQAQEAEAAAQRVQKQARETAQKALADAKKEKAALAAAAGPASARTRSDAWNKLASRLQKDLLQGRDNTPPEQYRAAIEAYFRILSETPAAAEK